ncbi:MAG: leucyl aminopeptidase [Polyangiaceae bacterium]
MNLKISLSSGAPEQQRADVLVVPLSKAKLVDDANVARLDQKLDGQLKALCAKADFTGRADQVFELPTLGKLGATRLLLLGVGDEQPPSEARLRHLLAAAMRSCNGLGAAQVAVLLPWTLDASGMQTVAEAVVLGAYRFDRYFTGERRARHQLSQVTLVHAGRNTAALKAAIELGKRIGNAVCIARDAVNEPPNAMTPAALAQLATEVAKRGRLKIRVLDEKGIDRMGMQLLAAVGQGSTNGPRFVHLTYSPKQKAKRRIVFLGKGLTFDSGGLCIKPAAGMQEMKSDMAGAAAVIGLMSVIADLKPNAEIHGLLVVAENMPDGGAYRPGDVFTSLDGKTVEIINTDAEGRLCLADGLAYARRLNPDLIIEASTLTGACLVALGKSTSAFYSTAEDWAGRFATAADRAGESFWRMPLLAELRDQLKSDIADLKHTGERWGGSITAALFLKEFVGSVPFIHCDIAGPALAERSKGVVPKGGTGHPVLTFVRFVEALR